MAAFRRTFLVLAVLALAATSVFAQVNPGFGCSTTPAVNATMRSGGLTELAGEVRLVCTGGNGTNVLANIQVQVPGTQITNRIPSGSMPPEGWPISAALQVSDIGNAPLQVVQGLLQASGGLVVFPNVVIPSGTTANIRITNIRVAAPTVTDANVVTPIFETISSVPFTAVPITNPSQQVGTVYQALTFSVTDCAGGSAPTLTFQQCIDQPTGGAGALSFGVKFSERNFGGGFKTQAQESGVSVPGVAPDNPLVVTDTADNGTRLIVTFTNVPNGVEILVTTREIAGSVGATASLVSNADSSGAGGTVGASGSTAATCDTGSGAEDVLDGSLPPATPAPAMLTDASQSGSTVFAVWEITRRPIGVAGAVPIASVVFGVQIKFTANPGADSPALTGSNPGSVTGNFAPVSTVAVADHTSPIPRFATAPVSGPPIFAIVPCVTNLLFPYVTSTQGFDTGFALVNTSADGSDNDGKPFNTSSQTGPCHLYFFGNMTIAPQDTDTVDPGTLIKFTLNAPPSTFQASTAGFEGYVIARCDFQYAHGLAFIVDTRVPGFGSQAYLALVIPDRTGGARPPDPFSTATAGTGEQLAQ